MTDTQKILLRLERMEKTQLALFRQLIIIHHHLKIDPLQSGEANVNSYKLAWETLSMLHLNMSETIFPMHDDPREYEK